MINRCKYCYFGDMCEDKLPCDSYSPIDTYDFDIDYIIEQERDSYREEWFKYTDENAD